MYNPSNQCARISDKQIEAKEIKGQRRELGGYWTTQDKGMIWKKR